MDRHVVVLPTCRGPDTNAIWRCLRRWSARISVYRRCRSCMWTIIACIVKWYRLFYDDRENKLVGIGPRYRGAAVNAPSMGTQRGAATCTSGPAEIRRFGAEKFENRLLGSTTSISLCEFELRDIKLRLRFLHFVAYVAQLGPAWTWVGRNRGRFSQPIPPAVDVFEKLLPIAGAHLVVLMAHPVIDEELPTLAFLQHRFTEVAGCMEAHACSPHFLEYGLEATPEEVLRRQHRAVLGLDEESTVSATNEVVEHLRDGRMQVDITASCGNLENVGDAAPILFSLLANVERLTVVGDVLLDTKRQQFRDADAASRKKRGSHLIPARRIRYKLCHLFTRQRGTVLLLLVHRRQANERKIPVTRMYLISIVIDCRPDNLLFAEHFVQIRDSRRVEVDSAIPARLPSLSVHYPPCLHLRNHPLGLLRESCRGTDALPQFRGIQHARI